MSSQLLLGAATGATNDLVLAVDGDGTVLASNDASETVLGRPTDVGASLLVRVHPHDRTAVVDRLADALHTAVGAAARPVRFRVAHALGRWVVLEIVESRRIDLEGRAGIVVVVHDVTELAEEEHRRRATCCELDFLVSRDPFTQLPDRQILLARLDALARRSTGRAVHVLLLVPRGLEDVSARLGADRATSIMRQLAMAIRDEVADRGVVGSDGTGQIVIVTDPGTPIAAVSELASRLLALVRGPIDARSEDLGFAAAICPLPPGRSTTAVLEQAGRAALDTASRGSPGPVICDVAPAAVDQTGTVVAIRHSELTLWYQPVRNLRSDRLVGFDVLIRPRFADPARPDDVAARTDDVAVVRDLVDLLVARACEQLADWQAELGERAPTLSLAVGGPQLGQLDVAGIVGAHLARTGAEARNLCLELTETSGLVAPALEQLKALRDSGVRLALGGFGTGASSLHHLDGIGVDVLKVDPAFAERLDHDDGSTEIVRAAVELGAAFGLRSIVEGVTTTGQRRLLESIGCDDIQGALVGPPVVAGVATAMLSLEHPSRGPSVSAIDIE